MSGGVLVTGGAGFIGSHLAEELLLRGERVRVADDLSTGERANLRGAGDEVDIEVGDLCDIDFARRACADVGVVYHLAARSNVPKSMEGPEASVRTDVVATANVLTAAREAGVRRVVFASSAAVYGGEGPFPQTEEATPAPKSPYAACKVCGEVLCRMFATTFGMDTVSLRFFNVYGPRQPLTGRYSGVVPAFVAGMLRGDRPVVFGDGEQTRDYIYVNDAARACISAGERGSQLGGAAVNIASGSASSVLDVLDSLGAVLGVAPSPAFEGERPGDVRHSLADVTRAEELLGFRAAVSLEDGLRRTVDSFRRELPRAE